MHSAKHKPPSGGLFISRVPLAPDVSRTNQGVLMYLVKAYYKPKETTYNPIRFWISDKGYVSTTNRVCPIGVLKSYAITAWDYTEMTKEHLCT